MLLDYSLNDHIATVTMNRPAQMNALNLQLRVELAKQLKDLQDSDDVWVVIITGAGAAFSSGHDLKERLTDDQKREDPGVDGIYGGLLRLDKPVIAAINGHCLAQGAGIALLSDIRVSADSVKFGWPQVRWGKGSASGPTILARAIPQNLAFEYLFTGEFIDAQRALDLHLLNYVVPQAQVMTKALELANQITDNAPLAIQAIKRATRETRNLDQQAAFRAVTSYFDGIRDSEDANEGRAAFAEKRRPIWKGN